MSAVLALIHAVLPETFAAESCRKVLEPPMASDYRDVVPFQEMRILADAASTEIYTMAKSAGSNPAAVNQSRIDSLTEILALGELQFAAFSRLSTILTTAPDESITFVAGDGPGAVQVTVERDGSTTTYAFPLQDGFTAHSVDGYRAHIEERMAQLGRHIGELQEVLAAASEVKTTLVNHEPTPHNIAFEAEQFSANHQQMVHYRNRRGPNRPTRLDLRESRDRNVREAYAALDAITHRLRLYIGRMTGRQTYSEASVAMFRAEILRQQRVITRWRNKMARLAREARDRGWPSPLAAQFGALQRHAEHFQRYITGIVRHLDILSAETPLFLGTPATGGDLRALALNAIGSAALSGELGEGPVHRGASYMPLSPYSIARTMEEHLGRVFGANHIDSSHRNAAFVARIQPMLNAFAVDHLSARDGARTSALQGMPLVVDGALAIRTLTTDGGDDATSRLFIFRVGDVVRVNGTLLRLTVVEGDERGLPTVRGQAVNADGTLGAVEFISLEHHDHWAWYAESTADYEAPIAMRSRRERELRNRDTVSGPMMGWQGWVFGTNPSGRRGNAPH